jgi:hypothetical protein
MMVPVSLRLLLPLPKTGQLNTRRPGRRHKPSHQLGTDPVDMHTIAGSV